MRFCLRQIELQNHHYSKWQLNETDTLKTINHLQHLKKFIQQKEKIQKIHEGHKTKTHESQD